jgi:hypothetical protein
LQCAIQVNLALTPHNVTFTNNIGYMFRIKSNNFKRLHHHIFVAVSTASVCYSVHQHTQVSYRLFHLTNISHNIFPTYVLFTYCSISNRTKTSQYKKLVLLYSHFLNTPVIQLQYIYIYIYVTANNFISSCQHHILFIIF